MSWLFANAILRLAVTIMCAIELSRFAEMLNRMERLGIGLMGGSAFLTIPVIIDRGIHGTPFDGWASTVFSLGAVIYFAGRMTRLSRHKINEMRQRRIAERHLAARGKL